MRLQSLFEFKVVGNKYLTQAGYQDLRNQFTLWSQDTDWAVES